MFQNGEREKAPISREVEATILYCDLVESTSLARAKELKGYYDMLMEFQELSYKLIDDHILSYRYTPRRKFSNRRNDRQIGDDYEWKVTGEEASVFLYSGDIIYDLRNALLLAIKLKLVWLASRHNQRNLSEGRPIVDMGLGVHCGKVILGSKGWLSSPGDGIPNIEGYAINKAKHTEQLSRLGRVFRVAVSERVFSNCQKQKRFPAHFWLNPQMHLKSGLGEENIYELSSFWDYELFSHLTLELKSRVIIAMEETAQALVPDPGYLWLYMLMMRYYLACSPKEEVKRRENLGRVIEMGSAILRRFSNEDKTLMQSYFSVVSNLMGHAFLERGDGKSDLRLAASAFAETLKVSPQDISAGMKLAECLAKLGNIAKAKQFYYYILSFDSGNSRVKRMLEGLESKG